MFKYLTKWRIADPVIYIRIIPMWYFRSSVIDELCQEIFGKASHTQISNYVIPCLASRENFKLPVDKIVAVLGSRSSKFLKACPAPPLLYSLLMLVRSNAGRLVDFVWGEGEIFFVFQIM